MSNEPQILNRTKYGSLVYCKSCAQFHLSYGQFHLSLCKKEFVNFYKFLKSLDLDYWEQHYGNGTKRKIPIPTLQDNLYLMLTRAELEEIKGLMQYDRQSLSILSVDDIDYQFILN
ncbi:MAG TPA: hypothetical protein PKL92_04055 [Aquaticitalea sp.]|nr:hypothetical protein [Aquaticitalea sp.]HNU59087.1 hypothetical protein [Aquaticitalea sp.]